MDNRKLDVVELVEQAKVLYSKDLYNDAIKLLNEALHIDPYYPETYETMCVCYIMMDQYADAEKIMSKYLLLNKRSGLAYFHLGNVALLQGKHDEAKALYSKAELLGYDNRVMYINLASYYEENGQNEKAIEQYSKVLRKNPFDYAVLDRKAQLQLRLGQYAEALETAKKMVSTDIDKFEGHHYVYVCLIALDQKEDAKTYFDDMILRFPSNTTVKFDRVRLMDLMGEVEQALAYIDQHFANLKDFPPAAVLKLGLLLKAKRIDDAISLVERNSFMLEDETVLTIMYTLYSGLEQYDKALEYCNKLEKLGDQASQYYATLYFRPLAEKKLGKDAKAAFERSVLLLKKAGTKNAANYPLFMYRALCEYQLEHYNEAKRIIEYVLAIAPNDAMIHMAASTIYNACGEEGEAIAHKQRALELDPAMVEPLI